jgi:dTDP-4-amino-4,6-dideoxygalactose transaminase
MDMKVDWPYEYPGVYWLDKQEDDAVLDVLHNGSMFRYYGLKPPGYANRYEEAAKKYYGVPYTLAINSGTGALMASMSALDVGPGCEVILPAFLWVATVGAVVSHNAIPVLCEVDDSLCMSPADLEKKITPRTKLIVPIHMAGTPCDMDGIMAVAKKHNVAVLEDCAQCNGGEFRGRKVGTIGNMGIFSLQLNKNMTCGEGGLVITSDEKLYNRAFAAHDMGLIRVQGRLSDSVPYAWMWGAGRRITELAGAVASVQIQKLPNTLAHMRASKKRIKAMLQGVPGLAFRKMNDEQGDTGPFIIIMLENEKKTLAVRDKLKSFGLHNICRIADYGLHMYYNIPSLVNKIPLSSAGNPWKLQENAQSVYDYNKGACPKSEALFVRSILIPVPSRLTEQQEKDAAQAIREAVTTV